MWHNSVMLCNIVGSTRHTPWSILASYVKVHKDGGNIVFITPSEFRMVGEFLHLLKIYRMKDAIMEMIHDKVFLEQKKLLFVYKVVR